MQNPFPMKPGDTDKQTDHEACPASQCVAEECNGTRLLAINRPAGTHWTDTGNGY